MFCARNCQKSWSIGFLVTQLICLWLCKAWGAMEMIFVVNLFQNSEIIFIQLVVSVRGLVQIRESIFNSC